jgi:hypothetical protein
VSDIVMSSCCAARAKAVNHSYRASATCPSGPSTRQPREIDRAPPPIPNNREEKRGCDR